ncbi:hypothetical protein [Micromonospora sp. NPDC050200]|uniref:hypothetical protein n=1 Tax=Micromonospora sp. NPDC050200 TaxID=3155664 RepID=UPI0033F7E4AD
MRAAFLMQNLSTTHAADIRDRDEIRLPAGRGRMPAVRLAAGLTTDVPDLLDRPPIEFARFGHDERAAWLPALARARS